MLKAKTGENIMNISKRIKLLWLQLPAFFLVGFLTVFLWMPPAIGAASLETANVMAPLYVANWDVFERQLDSVKQYGVDAVSVDVWWGVVEGAKDNKFNWSYYDKIFSIIKAHNFKIVPIFSFHQCGGNVGDDSNIQLPAWLWKKYVGQNFNGLIINNNDLRFKSEQGNYSNETLQVWADGLVANEYTDFVNAFKKHFVSYSKDFIEINVSTGPTGELRYPSYNGHDRNSDCPYRGSLQAYSRLAVQDFRNAMLEKYGNLAGVNTAWGTTLAAVEDIQPPDNADFFFSNRDYSSIRYGQDFVDWYNQSLVDHGRTLITNVITTLGTSFPNSKIGFKIPGVHWAMGHPTYPRAAEVAAGLIQTSLNFNADTTGHGYAKVVGLAQELAATGRGVVLHFTCLEKDNEDYEPQYSQAQSLVFWVASEAEEKKVIIKGENASPHDGHGWDNIVNAFKHASYTGFTALRIGNVASGDGMKRYKDFIWDCRNKTFKSENSLVH